MFKVRGSVLRGLAKLKVDATRDFTLFANVRDDMVQMANGFAAIRFKGATADTGDGLPEPVNLAIDTLAAVGRTAGTKDAYLAQHDGAWQVSAKDRTEPVATHPSMEPWAVVDGIVADLQADMPDAATVLDGNLLIQVLTAMMEGVDGKREPQAVRFHIRSNRQAVYLESQVGDLIAQAVVMPMVTGHNW